MMSVRWLWSILILLCSVGYTLHQLEEKDPSKQDPSKLHNSNLEGDRSDLANQNRPQTSQLEFYMDSSSDCSPIVRETGDAQVMIHGRGATQSGASPLTCELSIRVDQPRDPKKYKLSLLEMDIRDCSVNFYIYDGTRSQSMLGRYTCPSNGDSNFERVLWTSGNMATFYITRQSRENTLYSIRIQVQTIRGNTDWDTEWPNNSDYNRFYKFEQKWIVLIVGIGYIFIAAMTVLIFLICCCCIRRDGEKWQQSRFGTVNPSLNGSKTKLALNGSYGWAGTKPKPSNGSTTNSLRKVPLDVKKRMAGGSEDMDSVFESDGALMTRRLPPNNTRQRYQAPQSQAAHPRTKSTGNFGRNTEDCFVQADDDHPQDLFVQREILIPNKKKKRRPKEEYYTTEEEDLSSGGEEIEKVSSSMNTDPELKDDGVQYSEQYSEPESEKSDSADSADEEPESADPVYSKPNKERLEQPRIEVQEHLGQADNPSGDRRPRTPLGDMEEYHPQQPGHPQHASNYPNYQQPQYGQPAYHQPAYNQHDNRQPDYPSQPQQPEYRGPQSYYGSDVPSQPRGEHYPNMAPPPYQTSGRYPRYTPEPYQPPYDDTQYNPRPGVRPDPRAHAPPEVAPKDPPIYSYLVQRGYNPVDEVNNSPASSHHSLENRLHSVDDTLSANIGSGVEIMRR